MTARAYIHKKTLVWLVLSPPSSVYTEDGGSRRPQILRPRSWKHKKKTIYFT